MTRRALEIAATLVCLSMIGVMIVRLQGAHGLMLHDGQPLFGDFIAFWSAGRATLDGHVAHLHDRHFLAQVQQSVIVGMHVMAPWNSPPPFLLLLVPLALLPYPAAAVLAILLSGALYLTAACKWLPDARALLFAVTLPAAFYHLGTVQTGLLIAGLNGMALWWLDKRPRLAGGLIGLLVIKPHLAILWPVFLALSRRWTAFAAAAASTIALVLIAGLLFGFESYLRFYENLAASQDLISGLHVPRQTFASLYGNLLAERLPQAIAAAGHAISATCALIAAAVVFWRGDLRAQGAALCAATLLISPYLYFYDFTLLGLGAALLWPPRGTFDVGAMILAWLSGLTVAFSYVLPLPLCPFSAWLILIAALRRVEIAAPRLAPALQP